MILKTKLWNRLSTLPSVQSYFYLLKDKNKTSQKCRTKLVGEAGERIAFNYLKKRGLKLVEANWRCKKGEIDLIMTDKLELVFVEVKTRAYGHNSKRAVFQNITKRKIKKLSALSQIYLKYYYRNSKKPSHRIDVVGVVLDKDQSGAHDITHYKGAITSE
jgi:putative endonuclease